VIAVYSFRARNDSELSFETNDVIKVLAKEHTMWWKGQLISTGAIGLIPLNYVEPHSDQCMCLSNFNH
jgi:hypothetical protein